MIQRWMVTVKEKMGSAPFRRLLVVLGLVGMVLIGLSEWRPQKDTAASANTVTVTTESLEKALEERITAMLGTVQGVGGCRVMVTLENSVQQVYATEASHSTADSGSHSNERVLTVDTDTGPIGLPITQIQPTVRGVAVACDGGDDPTVNRQVTELVATVCHISSQRVCVVDIAK